MSLKTEFVCGVYRTSLVHFKTEYQTWMCFRRKRRKNKMCSSVRPIDSACWPSCWPKGILLFYIHSKKYVLHCFQSEHSRGKWQFDVCVVIGVWVQLVQLSHKWNNLWIALVITYLARILLTAPTGTNCRSRIWHQNTERASASTKKKLSTRMRQSSVLKTK